MMLYFVGSNGLGDFFFVVVRFVIRVFSILFFLEVGGDYGKGMNLMVMLMNVSVLVKVILIYMRICR